ncbi:MAG: protein-export chaperone SecB [Desulfurivibrio sp.]|nr:protein-export chaperone SecB [Desulfurivibrio sp.]
MSDETKGGQPQGPAQGEPQGAGQGQGAAAQGEAPVFRLQKMFVKDLSFENPSAPDVFLEKGTDPKVDVQLKLNNRQLEANDLYEVALAVTATVTNGNTGKTMFIIELEHAGIFMIKNVPAEHMPAVLAVECPTLLFPFTRQLISQTTVDGGFVPFLMDPVNFLALYENSRKQRPRQENGQSA